MKSPSQWPGITPSSTSGGLTWMLTISGNCPLRSLPRPADEATTLRDMLTDSTGKVWPEGIPPPLVRAEVLAQARLAAREVLAPQFAEMVEKTESLFFQPIFDLESRQLAYGRVALLGDA